MANSEYRLDTVTGLWTLISEERSKRPDQFAQSNGKKPLPEHIPDCSFCLGNEHKTPPEIWAYRNDNVWWTRTIPNKYPFFPESLEAVVEGQPPIIKDGIFTRMPAYGSHEVIIETPLHNQDIHNRPEDLVREMLWMYKERLIAHKDEIGLKNVVIFKNQGESAGASIEHPHTQLTAASTGKMQMLNSELEGSQRYFLSENFRGQKGQCVYCDTIFQEFEKSERIIAENQYFVAFLPFASRFPFETWVMPKKHSSDYTSINPDEAWKLASITKEVFEKLNRTLGNFDYNMLLHTTPLNSHVHEHYHWHFEIIPRLTKIAGFELSGIYVNVVAPERAAKILLGKQ